MPIKEKRVGTEGGKKSKSAYEKRQSRHGEKRGSKKCLSKKKRVGTERGKKSKSAYKKRQSRHGEKRGNKKCLSKKKG